MALSPHQQVVAPDFNQSSQDMSTIFNPHPDLNLLQLIAGGQQEQEPVEQPSPSYFQQAFSTVQDNLRTGNVKREEQFKAQQSLKGRLYELMAQRAQVVPEQAKQQKLDPKEAGVAALAALAGQLGGARNAGQAFNQFIGQRQGQAQANTQQHQQALDIEYMKRKQEIDAQYEMLNNEYADAGRQLISIDSNNTKMVGELSDMAQTQYDQDATTAREREKIQGLNDRAKGTWENRLANTKLSSDGKLALEQLKIDNPVKIAEIKEMADVIESGPGGKVAADKYINSMAEAQAIVNAQKKAQTETEGIRGKKMLQEIETIKFKRVMDEKEYKLKQGELKIKAQKHADSIETEEEEAQFKRMIGMYDADIATLNADIEATKSAVTFAKSLMDGYQQEMKAAGNDQEAYDTAKEAYDAAKADWSRGTNSIIDAQKQIAEQTKQRGKVLPRNGANSSNLRNGYIPNEQLRSIKGAPGHMALPDVADAMDSMIAAAKKAGVTIKLTDSYRSFTKQEDVKRRKPTLAATPGTSNHGWGKAFDISVGGYDSATYKWLRANASKYGFENPSWAAKGGSKQEPWHWEYTK